MNYADHAREAGAAVPPEPVFFNKAISCLNGPDDPIVLPPGSKKTDWEVELGVIIGTRARHVSEAAALEHVAGYCVVNDVSERAYQFEMGSQWDKGKGCDSFGPVGPFLVTRDEILDVQDLDLYLELNGKRMQTGNTSAMIFTVAQIVSYVSRFITLEPGDLITTGTPPGVGMGRKPQRFLKKGDVLRLGIAGLGEQQAEVVAAPK
jgi:2-keto-4-pentenoate hydratase/2-oxohepta-3-ene-1,7-dioic acid hydratase in catechol pathway